MPESITGRNVKTMCVICASGRGIAQPTPEQLRAMFNHNPHGAGYMFARDGRVTIHKGLMTYRDFARAVEAEQFTADDVVVYHFRISTQAGVGPTMTHPFPLTSEPENCELLDLSCDCGIAHNGIIRATSDPHEKRYSDTALFITRYLSHIIRSSDDLRHPYLADMIYYMAQSKFAILGHDGYLLTVGEFTEIDGNLYSNTHWQPVRYMDDRKFYFRRPDNFYTDSCRNRAGFKVSEYASN